MTLTLGLLVRVILGVYVAACFFVSAIGALDGRCGMGWKRYLWRIVSAPLAMSFAILEMLGMVGLAWIDDVDTRYAFQDDSVG